MQETGETRVSSWVGKIPGRKAWQPTLVFLPREWTEESSRLQSIGPQRVGHDWSDLAHMQNQTLRLCVWRDFLGCLTIRKDYFQVPILSTVFPRLFPEDVCVWCLHAPTHTISSCGPWKRCSQLQGLAEALSPPDSASPDFSLGPPRQLCKEILLRS